MKPTLIEIKAKCNNPKNIEQILKSLNADFKGIDHQIDTYFDVPNGRLKLRQGTIENHLIFYHRANQAGPKQSNVMLYPSPNSEMLKEILSTAIGNKVIIDKKRQIYFIDNVKFHIDEVKGLGNFMEIEAIVKLLQLNHFKGKKTEEIKKYTSTFYESGYWDFQKGKIQGRIFYDKMFSCDSRIVVDLDFHKLNRHAKIFVSVPKNNEERKELLAALYDLQFSNETFTFKEYTKTDLKK